MEAFEEQKKLIDELWEQIFELKPRKEALEKDIEKKKQSSQETSSLENQLVDIKEKYLFIARLYIIKVFNLLTTSNDICIDTKKRKELVHIKTSIINNRNNLDSNIDTLVEYCMSVKMN